MIVLGIDISSSEMTLVILDGARANHKIIPIDNQKIKLALYPAAKSDIQNVAGVLNALIAKHNITDIVFKKYPIDGKFTSGLAIHWQGALVPQVIGTHHFVAPQTLSATKKKQSSLKKATNYKYLQDAYDLAFEKLP